MEGNRLLRGVAIRVREARYRVRRIGVRKALRYYGIELAARHRQPLPRHGQPFDLGGATFVVDETTERSIRSHWVEYAHGIVELEAFKGHALGRRCLLDVGAAEGIYSAAFCALTGGDAWAIEPSADMFESLTRLRRANPHLSIVPVNTAFGAKKGVRPCRAYPDGQVTGAVHRHEATGLMHVATVDEFVVKHQLVPDFAKIDVEGMELDVLRGGQRTFGKAVQTIMLEVHQDALQVAGESLAELQRIISSYGFRLEALDGERIDDLGHYVERNPEPLPGYTVVVCQRP